MDIVSCMTEEAIDMVTLTRLMFVSFLIVY